MIVYTNEMVDEMAFVFGLSVLGTALTALFMLLLDPE